MSTFHIEPSTVEGYGIRVMEALNRANEAVVAFNQSDAVRFTKGDRILPDSKSQDKYNEAVQQAQKIGNDLIAAVQTWETGFLAVAKNYVSSDQRAAQEMMGG